MLCGWEGLASHRPCVTDFVVYPPTGSVAFVWEMSTLPTPSGHGTFTLLRLQVLRTIRTLDDSYDGLFVPWKIRTMDFSYHL